VEEVRKDLNIPEELRPFRIAIRERFAGSFSVPLVIGGEVFGGMVFYYTEPQSFAEDQIQLGLTFAEQVALAIENAQLHEADEARQRELQILLDVAETANSSLDLDELLASTLDLLVSQLDISRCGVSLVDENTGYLLPYLLRPDHPASQEDSAAMMEAAQTTLQAGEMRYISPDPEVGLFEPAALIPLLTRGQKLGMLGVIGKEGQEFGSAQLNLFRSIANQLSIAIVNARLFEQAEENAITTERNRLARDLHDAVTQTLFSASLIADVLPKIWSRDPQEGQKRLEELRQLTRGALSEMRTLLVELRPAALEDADLKDLINHLVNAFTARTRLEVDYQVDFYGNPPPEIKEMIYRITQEGFNNITKHADAHRVVLKLESRSELVRLTIADDGVGFDTNSLSSEGLGLGIMQERVKALSARLDIHSKIGEGTEITVTWESGLQE
jgi:signal transduction histidine kinase